MMSVVSSRACNKLLTLTPNTQFVYCSPSHIPSRNHLTMYYILTYSSCIQCMYGWMTVYNAIDLWMTVHT